MKSSNIEDYEKLRHIFENNLNVGLLSEEIFGCLLTDDSNNVKKKMDKLDFDVFGVENMGEIVGYVKKSELHEESIKDFYREFSSKDLISDSTSLLELLDILQDRDFIFVLKTNEVSKIVTISDLHKQPIRMLTFSLISLLEMYLTTIIKETYPNESWKDKLKENRLKKAQEMLDKRLEKNIALTLLESTQLCDKGEIIKNTPKLIEKLDLKSKNKCANFFKELENLRNNTAHSQQVLYHDDKELIRIMLKTKEVLVANSSIIS